MQWKSHSHPCPQSTLFLPHPQHHWEPILLVLSTSFQSIFMKMQAYMIHIFIVSSLLTRSLLILTVLHVASFCSTVFLGDSHESVASETPHSPCSVGNHRGHTLHTQAVSFLIGGWMVFRLLLLQTSTVCNLVHTSFPSCLCTDVHRSVGSEGMCIWNLERDCAVAYSILELLLPSFRDSALWQGCYQHLGVLSQARWGQWSAPKLEVLTPPLTLKTFWCVPFGLCSVGKAVVVNGTDLSLINITSVPTLLLTCCASYSTMPTLCFIICKRI